MLRQHRARRALVMVVTALTLALVGNVAAGADVGRASKPHRGGDLVYLSTADIISNDPALQTNNLLNSPRSLQIFDMLAMEETSGKITLRTAESIESTDNVTWTVKLHPNIKFTDGTDYDAEAVRFNWARMQDPATRSFQFSVVSAISSMTVVDTTTLQVTLKAADPFFPRAVATGIPFIGSPKALTEKGTAGFSREPVGAGPYMVKSYSPSNELVLVRNPNYWGEAPYLDSVTIRFVLDESQRLNTFQTGGAQLMATGSDPTTPPKAEQAGYKVVSVVVSGGPFITFNTTKAPFDDVRARRAVAYAFDPDAFNQALFGGAAVSYDTLFTSTSPFYDQAVKQQSPSETKAQKLFDTLAAEGKPVKFTIEVADVWRARGEWLLARLASFKNVEATLSVIATAQAIADLRPGNYQLGWYQHTFIDPVPVATNLFSTGGSMNYAQYSNPEMDAALQKAVSTTDVAVRKEAYKTVQKLYARDVPFYFYMRSANTHIFDSKVLKGFRTFADGSPRFDLMWLARS
jgi:peptide/nickel transport system substrate-binding protein